MATFKNLIAASRAPFVKRFGLAPNNDGIDYAWDNGFRLKARNAADTADYKLLGLSSDNRLELGGTGEAQIAPTRSADAYAYGLKVESFRELTVTAVSKAADAVISSVAHGLSVGQTIEFRDAMSGSWTALNVGTLGTINVKATPTPDTFTIETDTAAYTGTFDGKVYAKDSFFKGTAAQKSYLLYVRGDRSAAYAATGDSNDAVVRVDGNNWAANDTNFIFRGLNVSLGNRAGGTLGTLEHALGVQAKSGGTAPTVRGLSITAENYGTCATEFGGLDITLKNEAAVATTEYGIRVRNLNNSLATAVGAGFTLGDSGANIGFTYGLDTNGATIQTADLRLHNGDIVNNSSDGVLTLGSAANPLSLQLGNDDPILDSSGLELLKFSKTATAVNEFTIANAATAGSPTLSVTGGDTNVSMKLEGKAGGYVRAGVRTWLTTTGDTIGFHTAPAQGATTTGDVYGARITPRMAATFGAANLIGALVEPILKGSSGDLSGSVIGLKMQVTDENLAGRTIGGSVVIGGQLWHQLAAHTITGAEVLGFDFHANGGATNWTSAFKFAVANGLAADKVSAGIAFSTLEAAGNRPAKFFIKIGSTVFVVPCYNNA